MQVPYFARRLGVCVGDIPYAGQTHQMVLIRLGRVDAYLNMLNPESVRAGGNEAAADWLEAKHQEWDDLLHASQTYPSFLWITPAVPLPGSQTRAPT